MVTNFTSFLLFSILCFYTITPAQTTIGNLASYSLHPTGIKSGYGLISNGTPQTIWQDPMIPANVHMVFMYSAQNVGYTDRTNLYLFSDDSAHSWSNLGPVPSNGSRSGFGAITGLSNGRVVIAGNSEDGGSPMRTQLYVQEFPGATTFLRNDPGVIAQGNPIWPRLAGIDNNKIFFLSSLNNGVEGLATNLLTLPDIFRGYYFSAGAKGGEAYSTAVSEDQTTLGLIYLGVNENHGDLFYIESNDVGVTWNIPLKIWDYEPSNGTNGLDSMGILRGMQLVYIDNSPVAIFEINIQSNITYTPNGPTKIVVWHPGAGDGGLTYLAEVDPLDTAGTIISRIPFYQVKGPNEVMTPICRPTLGRSSDSRYLFAAFQGTNGTYFSTGTDSISYWGTYFTRSSDKGATWSKPERFTDGYSTDVNFMYPSISPSNYSNPSTKYYTVQMFMIADSMPRNNPQMFISTECANVTASFYGSPVSVRDDQTPFTFELKNNYPNPFNPSTKISFSLGVDSRVSIKVFDLLGQKAAELVNNNLSAGEHTVDFNASKLASGVYIYRFEAVSSDGQLFTASKKMILNK